ncbi:hypothetical protein Fmac_025866 [Flemingia macrophylla]|uniref:Sulfotransferase n=1 Tax=Flemingia macrophylla TaxID=520843 RepID=A0ABD1LDB2_9FABA
MSAQQELQEENLVLSLRKESAWASPYSLYQFQNFLCPAIHIQAVNNCQKYFEAKDNDVIVASFPKSGTIWMKALAFAIVNHQRLSTAEKTHPLLTSNPHELVPFLEFIYAGDIPEQNLLLSKVAEPRVFGTHTPLPSLSKSIVESNCKIIYICRNPFDNFVSAWNYFNKIKPADLSALPMDEAFEIHMLGYWKESIARPNKVLFLKYDDLKKDTNLYVKKVAEFLGCPFTEEEENNGVVDNIVKICSFDKMKDLNVNKSGTVGRGSVEKKNFFRKGETGDWVNYFSPSMIEKLSKIVEEKLSGSGLSFKEYYQNN